MLKNLLFAAVIVTLSPAFVFAADIFFAFGQGAAASDTATASISDNSGSVFIYSKQDFAFDSADLNFTNSDSSVIQFTGGVAFNSLSPGPFGDFLKFDSSVVSFSSTPLTDGRLLSIAILENGVNPLAAMFDLDFDAAVRVNSTPDGALMLARLDYDIVGAGTANFSFTLGSNGVITLGSDPNPDILLSPSLGSASLTVTEAEVIPEPSSVALLMLGSIGLVTRRKRA